MALLHLTPPITDTGPLSTVTLGAVNELESLAVPWARLAGWDSEPMQSHAWSLSAAHTLHAGSRLAIVTVWRGQSLAAVAPLVEVRRAGVPWLEVLGARSLGEPVRLLADGPDARRALARAIVDLRMPVLLQCLDRGAWSEEFLHAARGRAVSFVVPGASCLRAEFDGGWESYTARLSTERQASLRRKSRQLEREGELIFDSRMPSPAEVSEVLHSAFAVEARSWKRAAHSAVAQRPAQLAFFEAIGRHFAAEGKLLVRRLRVGGADAAVHVGVVESGRSYELKIGYDERWSRFSPGLQLTWHCLRDASERGLRAHEFLGAAADWQRPFATSERQLENIVVYAMSPAGLWSLAADGAAVLGRRALRLAGCASRRIQRALRPNRPVKESRTCAA